MSYSTYVSQNSRHSLRNSPKKSISNNESIYLRSRYRRKRKSKENTNTDTNTNNNNN